MTRLSDMREELQALRNLMELPMLTTLSQELQASLLADFTQQTVSYLNDTQALRVDILTLRTGLLKLTELAEGSTRASWAAMSTTGQIGQERLTTSGGVVS